MASILRQVVASPRVRHSEAGLDLCYVTDNLIATSGPGATYPQVAYRNPLKDLVKFLDSRHGQEWAIWEFRAEGTGYPDEEVYGRIRHYPWPDHHPPPFGLLPLIVSSMRTWLDGGDDGIKGRVAVVHCKAGKGRSGTVACSYLISEEGWTVQDAKRRFTERRMRPGFGSGISIPSQVRWVDYVERWARNGKIYVEREVEVLEVHVWGLRNGVKVAVEGFVEEGKVIKTFHIFGSEEREIVRGKIANGYGLADVALEAMGKTTKKRPAVQSEPSAKSPIDSVSLIGEGGDAVFRPSSRIVLPTSDINIDFERRNRSKYGGFTMVTSVAHVWFNTFFEGRGPEQSGTPDDSGVFEIDWEAMDGIKGSSRKGTRAFDRLAVVWKAIKSGGAEPELVVTESADEEDVPQARPADWKGNDGLSEDFEKKLGLRAAKVESAGVSRASSVETLSNKDGHQAAASLVPDEIEGVKPHGPDGETVLEPDSSKSP